jgi:CHAT domain-containing protein/tetratricopeptide (TPR) repeat protein
MKRILLFAVMVGLGFFLAWGSVLLPGFLVRLPAFGVESSLSIATSPALDGGLSFETPRLLFRDLSTASLRERVPIANHVPPTQTAAIDRGRQLYRSGNFEEAVGVWQTIADGEQGIGRSIALSNLSLCLQKLGRWEEATIAVEESVSLLRSVADDDEAPRVRVLAQTLEIQGDLEFEIGQFDASLDRWKEAAQLYTAIGDREGILRSQLDSVRALQALGLYRRAEQTLTEVATTLQAFPDSELKVAGFQNLGYVLRLLGRLGNLKDFEGADCKSVASRSATVPLPDSAADADLWSLAIAQHLGSAETIRNAQFSLANTARAIYQSQKDLDDPTTAQTAVQTALSCYQKAATSTIDSTQLRAKLNLLSLSIELAQRDRDRPNLRISLPHAQLDRQIANWRELSDLINALPPGRTAIYAQLDLAQSLMKVDRLPESEALFSSAVQQSQTLGNPRIRSYALGYLGQFYEQLEDWEKARKPTEEALLLAQSMQAGDIAYQWQWQLGRILKQQPQPNLKGAIAAYDEAVKTLKSLRRDLVAVSQDVQFDFRDRVEPVYREYVDLLLQPENPPPENLKRAREAIEELQLAELDNFFRDACLQAKPQTLDLIDSKAVAIYNIVLDDRMEVIAQLPGQGDNNLFHYRVRLPKPERVAVLKDLRQQLQLPYAYAKIKQLSQKAYQWLIAPLEPHLQGDETLVFVLDGEWRNISVAALYDGEQYLIEKYPIAIQPSFQLLDSQPLSQPLKGITAGLENYPGWPSLPKIEEELKAVQDAGIETFQLLDNDFTKAELEALIRSNTFGVMHLATHGQFSSRSENTFILAADGPIDLKQLDNLLRSRDLSQAKSIDLLVLTACQTAEGDDRAILGLAGMAVRVGARSTLASLWSLQHESVEKFIGFFYQKLIAGASRADSLRYAQLEFLKQKNGYDAPLYWAPYVLVGDWR